MYIKLPVILMGVMYEFHTTSVEQTVKLGRQIGSNLQGSEVIEFISDLGGGKTTMVGGIVSGFGSSDPVASPSFTISYTYSRPDKKQFHHFDFYRLDDAGVVGAELEEFLHDPDAVVAVEWGEAVHKILPKDCIKILISLEGDTGRKVQIECPEKFQYILKGVEI